MRLTRAMLEAIRTYAAIATAQTEDGGDYSASDLEQAERVRDWAAQKLASRATNSTESGVTER